MRIITERRLREAAAGHPNVKPAITRWIHIVRKAQWKSLAQARQTFRHADQVKIADGRILTIFNLGDNHRLITAIHYNRNLVFIRKVLTHAEYDKDRWKENP